MIEKMPNKGEEKTKISTCKVCLWHFLDHLNGEMILESYALWAIRYFWTEERSQWVRSWDLVPKSTWRLVPEGKWEEDMGESLEVHQLTSPELFYSKQKTEPNKGRKIGLTPEGVCWPLSYAIANEHLYTQAHKVRCGNCLTTITKTVTP